MKNFELFYKENYGLIKQCLIKYKNIVPDEDELESIANVCFLKAYNSYNEKNKFSTFYHRCVRNKCLDYKRKRDKERLEFDGNYKKESIVNVEVFDIDDLTIENECQREIIKGIINKNSLSNIRKDLSLTKYVFSKQISRLKKLNEKYFSNN